MGYRRAMDFKDWLIFIDICEKYEMFPLLAIDTYFNNNILSKEVQQYIELMKP
jgi:hypothetical protein